MTTQLTIASLQAELTQRNEVLHALEDRLHALEAERDATHYSEAGQRWFLEAMAGDASIPIIVIDGEARTTKWSNPAWQRLISNGAASALTGLIELTSHARPEEIAARMAQAGRPFYQGEFQLASPESGLTYWRCTFLLMPAAQKRPSDVMVLIADITARKSMEESLRETRDQMRDEAGRLEQRVRERTAELEQLNAALRAEINERETVEEAHRVQAIRLREQADLLDLAPDAIMVRDWSNHIRFWNAGARQMYGWTTAEVADRNVQEVLRTDFTTPLAEIEAELEAKGRWEGELVHTRRDGSQITVLSRWALRRDDCGHPSAVLETNTNISAQKRAQAQITYQAHLLAHISDMICATDLQGRITAWNQAAEQALGLKAADVLGKAYNEVLHASCIDCSLEHVLFQLLHDGAWRGDVTLHRPDGSELPVEARIMALPGGEGDCAGYVAVVRDLTARKKSERAVTEHVRRLELLHDIDRAILAARSPQEIAATALKRVREVTGVRRASIMLFDPQTQTMMLLAVDGAAGPQLPPGAHLPMDWPWLAECRRGKIAIVEDFGALPRSWPETDALIAHGMRSSVGFPLTVGQQVIGAMTVARAESGPPPEDLLTFGRQVADSLAVTLQNARLFAQVEAGRQQTQSFSRRLVQALEDERRTIARELHDEAGQSLTTLSLGLGQLKREPAERKAFEARIADLQQITSQVMEDLHRIAVDLRPIALDRYGLLPALEQYIEGFGRRSGLKVQFGVVGLAEERFAPEVETALYRVVQEALTNITRHAGATQIGVVVERSGAKLMVIIEDNGCGFDIEEALDSGRLGLLGMRERAELLGGSLAIESSPGAGCSIYATVPLGS